MECTHTIIGGNHPEVLHNGAKMYFFSITKPMLPFGHLSCTNFDHLCRESSYPLQPI